MTYRNGQQREIYTLISMCICFMASKKEFACRCHQPSMSHKHSIPIIAQEFRIDLLARGWHLDTFWVVTNLNPVHRLEFLLC